MKLRQIQQWIEEVWEELPFSTQEWIKAALYLLTKAKELGVNSPGRKDLEERIIRTLAAVQIRGMVRTQLDGELRQLHREYRTVNGPQRKVQENPVYGWYNRTNRSKRTKAEGRGGIRTAGSDESERNRTEAKT